MTTTIASTSLRNLPSDRGLQSKSILCQFLLYYGVLMTIVLGIAAPQAILPFVEGAAIPPIRSKMIRGFRLRNVDGSGEEINAIEFDDELNPLEKKQPFFRSFLRNIRNRGIPEQENISDDENSLPSLQPQQHGLPLACWVLASKSFEHGNNLPGKLNPKWLLVGGVVYQSQKALRSEAVRRAARFWVKIGPVVAHYKFTRWWLRTSKADLEHRDAVYGKLHEKYAPITMQVALNLKGLYVKLAQVVSSRPDFVPLQYIQLFVAAQDSLPQWPIDEVRELVEASLRKCDSQLSFEQVFEDMDAIALGSASIGQCHKAKIRGKYAKELFDVSNDHDDEDELSSIDVAVKVMHPGAEERFKHDFSVFRWLCKVALTGWEPILDELYRQIMSEFDYQREADCLDKVRTNMCNSPFSKSVTIPTPLPTLCSKELLVMELLEGDKLSDSLEDELKEILGAERSQRLLDRKRLELVLGKDKLEKLESYTEENLLQDLGWATKLRLLGLYRRAQTTIDKLVDVQGYQMLKDGIFQGDPHPGNILELKKSKTKGGGIANYYPGSSSSLLGLIDYGQTKIITDDERLGVAKVILALGENNGKDAAAKTEVVANAMRDLGFSTQKNDSKVLEQYAGLFFDSDEIGKKLYDCPTPQTYFKLLTELDPLVNVPDVAIFVARCGFILRGMGSILGKQIKTSERWSVYAKEALNEAQQA
eukprot:CAMPEP_0116122852 /NCGR_PEP_ID=MMETSP0329-20121206/4433_1 /TAXON_ID=697910 /ORGANISM="Pseudo-nitzschia arenysensis, Strain B593" /LENGTH=704 /DNA_ID=CAMNT_0003616723 /DNA_START=143 /DNA_END=2257 /DNA_ORIENTATION=+